MPSPEGAPDAMRPDPDCARRFSDLLRGHRRHERQILLPHLGDVEAPGREAAMRVRAPPMAIGGVLSPVGEVGRVEVPLEVRFRSALIPLGRPHAWEPQEFLSAARSRV